MLLGAGVAHGTDLFFTLTDSAFGIAQTTNRQVIVQSESGTSVNSPNVLLPFKLNQTTSALGICAFSNLFGGTISGYYHVTIPAPPQRADFDVFISNTNLGQIQASTVIGVFGASTYPADSFAWSAQVSDARYAQNVNNTVSFAQLLSTSNSLVAQFMAGDNVFGTSSTNYANSLSTALTNLGFTIGTAGSNNVQTLSNILAIAINSAKTNSTATNLLGLALNQVTNIVNGVSPVISTNPTNDLQTAVTGQIVAATNALTSGLTASIINSSNVVELHVKNATNGLQVSVTGQINLLSVAVTNAINQSGINGTNFANTIGAQATNFANVGLTSTGALAFAYTTNLVAATSNALTLKIDATNIVNVAFSNGIANAYGLGTNTTLRTAVSITVTNFQASAISITNNAYIGTVGSANTNFVIIGESDQPTIAIYGSTAHVVIGSTNNTMPTDFVNDMGVGIFGGNFNTISDDGSGHMRSINIFGGWGNGITNKQTFSNYKDNNIFGGVGNYYFGKGDNNSIFGSSNCFIFSSSVTASLIGNNIVASKNSDMNMVGGAFANTFIGAINSHITNANEDFISGRNVSSTFDNSWIWSSGPTNFFPVPKEYTFNIYASNGVKVVTGGGGMTVDGVLIGGAASTNPTNDLNTALTAAINQLGVNDSNYSRLVTNGLNFATHPEVQAATNGVFAWGNATFSTNNAVRWGTATNFQSTANPAKIYFVFTNNQPLYGLILTN